MPRLTDAELCAIAGVMARMRARREREVNTARARYTLSYAVSVQTGECYVGYNNAPFDGTDYRGTRWLQATGYNPATHYAAERGHNACAEAWALSVALSYDERLENLVFLTMNLASEPFHPCNVCQEWVLRGARGVLVKEHEEWQLRTREALTDREWDMILEAGSRSDHEDFRAAAASLGRPLVA